MLQRIALLLLLLVLVLPTRTVGAGAQDGSRASTRQHGLEITLAVPRLSYPQNALIQAGLIARNVSHRAIWVNTEPHSVCEMSSSGVYVEDDAGRLLYPPVLTAAVPIPWLALGCATAPGRERLAPGQSITRHFFAILRGRYLWAEALLFTKGSAPQNYLFHSLLIRTPPLTLQLTPATAPQITLHISGGQSYAVVERPEDARGPLYYQNFIQCVGGSGTTGALPLRWPAVTGNEIRASCAPRRWVLVAGWLNYPVATSDYIERQSFRVSLS
jgi:hypothetical protein